MARLIRRKNVAFRVSAREAAKRLGESATGLSTQRINDAADLAKIAVIRRALPMVRRAVTQTYGIRASALADKYKVVGESKSRSTRGGVREAGEYITVLASTRRISLLEFGGRGRRYAGGNDRRAGKPGAQASVVRGERKAYAHAFIANVGWRGVSGGAVKADTVRRGIYVRKYMGAGKRHGRGPLTLLRGPSPWEMVFGPGGLVPGGGSALNLADDLADIYAAEIARQLARGRRK